MWTEALGVQVISNRRERPSALNQSYNKLYLHFVLCLAVSAKVPFTQMDQSGERKMKLIN
jgi:hypothetical protein